MVDGFMIIRIYENERVPLADCGTAQDREHFVLSHPMDIHINQYGIKFYNPGIYQFGPNSPLILVLPFFFQGKHGQEKKYTQYSICQWFDLISSFSTNLGDSVKIPEFQTDDTSWEPLIYSVLLLTSALVKESLTHPFFQKESEDLRMIRGKWNVQRDIRATSRPTKFSCSVTTAKYENILLNIVKSIAIVLHRYVSSRTNQAFIEDLNRILKDVSPAVLSPRTFALGRKFLIDSASNEDWCIVLEFFHDLILEPPGFLRSKGISFKLPMDVFFEDFLSQIFQKLDLNFRKQYSLDVLGGSEWGAGLYETKGRESSAKSRPDFVVESEKFTNIIEAKYKPLVVPPQKSASDVSGASFQRNDRNQVLSFALGYLSQHFERRLAFSVVYPFATDNQIEVNSLRFPFAEMLSQDDESKIAVKRAPLEEERCLKIDFVGVDIAAGIDWLQGGDNLEFGEKALKAIG